MGILSHIPWFKRQPALPQGTVWMEQQMKGNPLWGANPDRLVSAVTAWDAGYIAELARIVSAYEMHDDVAKTGVRKRDAAVARCEHSILIEEGFEKDPRAQLHKDILTRFWATVRVTSAFNRAERGGIRLLKKQMMSAQSIGWSCHNIIWDTSDPAEIKAKFIHLPMWHFENTTGELRFKRLAADIYGVPMADGEWLVHTGDAIGPAVALACCTKRLSLQDWMLFSERAATPGLLGKTSAAPGTDAWNKMTEMLENWGRAWVSLVDRDSEVTTVNLNTGEPPMPRLVERMDRAIAALYRGADLSTISKGEGLGASLQGEESDMLEIDDCISLSESLHEQVDRYVIRYMTGDAEPLAYIWIEPVSKPNIEAEIAVDNHLMGAGVKLSKRDMLQRYGRTAADPDDPEDAAELQAGFNTPETGFNAPINGVRGLANAKTPFKTREKPFKNARRLGDGQGEGERRPPSQNAKKRASAIDALEALSKDTSEAAQEISKLMENPTPEAASALMGKLPELLPEDPELAAVIAEVMAEAYGEAYGEGIGNRELGIGKGRLADALANMREYKRERDGKFAEVDNPADFEPGDNPDSAETQAAEIGKGKKAIEKCLAEGVDVLDAVSRGDIGSISLRYGDEKGGLAHFKDRKEAVEHLAQTLVQGKAGKPYQQGQKLNLTHGGFVATLRLTEDKKAGLPKNWVLTSFGPNDKKEGANI